MRSFRIALCLFCCMQLLYAQENNKADLEYLEDQLYFSLTYDVLAQKPTGIEQNGLSGGFSIGFIKDIPFNNKRNRGIAIGLGYSYDAFIQNLKIVKGNDVSNYEQAFDYNSNSLRLHSLEVPIELRWRNSTPTRYKFWRVYTGFQFSYIVTSKSIFSDASGTTKVSSIPEIEKLLYGVYISTGYATWNVYAYFGLNSVFNNATINAINISPKIIKIGLRFYMM